MFLQRGVMRNKMTGCQQWKHSLKMLMEPHGLFFLLTSSAFHSLSGSSFSFKIPNQNSVDIVLNYLTESLSSKGRQLYAYDS